MRFLFIVMSFMFCFSNFAMTQSINYIPKVRNITQLAIRKIFQPNGGIGLKVVDMGAAIGISVLFRDVLETTTQRQTALIDKINKYEKGGKITSAVAERYKLHLKNCSLNINTYSKYAVAAGLFTPVFLKSTPAMPISVAVGGPLFIGSGSVYSWNRKIKQINYCIDHFKLDRDDIMDTLKDNDTIGSLASKFF